MAISTRSPRRPRRRRGPRLRAAAAVLFAAAAVAAAYLAVFRLRFYTVSSNSMSPTLMGTADRRDRVLCWLGPFPGREPERWEIVVFHTPGAENPAPPGQGGTPSARRGMTVKRVVGLGGESLALRGGDVWTRGAADGAFRRRAKPAAVQDALWIPVYGAEFPGARDAEGFARFWRSRNGDAAGAADGLFLPAGAEFGFVPRVRAGMIGRELRELPGVPDRYLLPQRLTLTCPGCGSRFTRWFAGGQVQELCPACGAAAYEEDVLVYSHDSGLTTVGPDAARGIPSGGANRFRVYPYHIVGDLRLSMEARLPDARSALSLRLERNGAADEIALSPSGIALNGVPLSGGPDIGAAEWFAAEFSRVDGELRLSIGGTLVPLPQNPARQTMPDPDPPERVDMPVGAGEEREEGEGRGGGESSGVSFSSAGAGATVRRIAVDRDIHYFGGAGNPYMPQFSAMTPEGGIEVPAGSFLTLGDNTDVSLDSRGWGALPDALLAGTALWWDKGERPPAGEGGE